MGTVPSCIGQTAYAVEWCGAAVMGRLACARVDGGQDCKGVVQEWNKPLRQQLRPTSVHAGQPKALDEGHVDEGAAETAHQAKDAKGNALADAHANIAREKHPQPSHGMVARVARDMDGVKAVLVFAAKVLAQA